jgi:hypothetical protein
MDSGREKQGYPKLGNIPKSLKIGMFDYWEKIGNINPDDAVANGDVNCLAAVDFHHSLL